jgi:uncharacterized protein
MQRVFVFFSILGSFLILCQWYVFSSIREHLLSRTRPISRKVAYPVLGLLGVLNVVAVQIAMGGAWLPEDSESRKVATVLFFSYLGSILLLSLWFAALGMISRLPRLKNALFAAAASVRGSAGSVASEKGCVVSSPSKSSSQLICSGSPPPVACECDVHHCPVCESESMNIPSIPFLTRRSFLKRGAIAGVGFAAGTGTYGLVEAYRPPLVEEFHLSHPDLEGIERPVTIIHVTDFHFGLFLRTADLHDLVSRVNSIPGDALAITGDVFHSPISPVEPATPILKKLRPRSIGNFVVMGNHDFYAGEWRSIESFRKSGLTILRNRWLTFDLGPAKLHMGGMDDPMVNWAWGKEFPNFMSFAAMAPTSPGMKVLLSHRPGVFPMAAAAGMDLVLSGHIHGGQIILPTGGPRRGLSLARVASEFTNGWYEIGPNRMYLNRGVGLTFIPWRINCPPEIAVFHLHAPSGRKGDRMTG